MRIEKITPQPDWKLSIQSEEGIIGEFDVKPYLDFEAFQQLNTVSEFKKVSNGGYFVEWDCGADLSADTIEAQWTIIKTSMSTRSA